MVGHPLAEALTHGSPTLHRRIISCRIHLQQTHQTSDTLMPIILILLSFLPWAMVLETKAHRDRVESTMATCRQWHNTASVVGHAKTTTWLAAPSVQDIQAHIVSHVRADAGARRYTPAFKRLGGKMSASPLVHQGPRGKAVWAPR